MPSRASLACSQNGFFNMPDCHGVSVDGLIDVYSGSGVDPATPVHERAVPPQPKSGLLLDSSSPAALLKHARSALVEGGGKSAS